MSEDRIAARTAQILAQAGGLPRVKALSKAERETWARSQAENELSAETRAADLRAEAAARRAQSRRRGRPSWPQGLVARRYREAVKATPEPRTPSRIAEHFVRLDGSRGIEPDSLGRLLRQHGVLRAG
jgi:hypothetical protein